MNRNKLVVLLALFALIFASLACNAVTGGGNDGGDGGNDNNGFSFTTANIQDAHMARDFDDTDRTNVFSPSDEYLLLFLLLEKCP